MTTSEAYADLGGGIRATEVTRPPSSRTRSPQAASAPQKHEHRFDRQSGWCDCGERDTGELAVGSPAWRAELEGTR